MTKIDKSDLEKMKGTGAGEKCEDKNICKRKMAEEKINVEVFDKPLPSGRGTLRASKSPEQKTQGLFDVKDILNKNFPSAICQHCKKVTNIQFSNDFRKLISRNRTLSEINKTLTEDWRRWMNIKNGQIEAMHKMIAEFIELIPEEQRENSKKITREMRDEIRHIKRKFKRVKNG